MNNKAIVLDSLAMSFGSKVLFENVEISFVPGNKYALTGPNGSGKSTMMKIIMGTQEPTFGTVSRPKKTGMLNQNPSQFSDKTVRSTVIWGNPKLAAAIEELDLLYESGKDDNKTGMRIAELQDIIYENNGYSAESDAEQLLEGMHINANCYDSLLKNVPLDVQLRVLLCQALFGDPDALLLDEPTNFLDLETIGWLEEFLASYNGVVIVTSHDKHFLNSVATHVADIDYETLILYPGNYDDMITAKSCSREQAEADIKSKEKKIAQLRQFVSKFGAGTRASQVRSREREIEKLQPEELKQSNIKRPFIKFAQSDNSSGEIVVDCKNISFGYTEEMIIKNFSFEILRGEKIGLIGNNGMGKTTLLKLIASKVSPNIGTITLGHNVHIGYFPQRHNDAFDNEKNEIVFEWLRKTKNNIQDQAVREALGRMLFSGDAAFKKVSALSGGESARLILASLAIKDTNFLILDEPNNHMDIESVRALTDAIINYKGSAIIASHDRDLIQKSCSKIIYINKEKAIMFNGKLEEFLDHKK